MQIVLQTVFVVFFILHVSFVKLSVGLPLKDWSLLLLFILIFFAYSRQMIEIVSRLRGLLAVFLALGLFGLALTILNRAGISASIEAVPRMLIQPMLVVICTYALASLYGVRFVAAVFIGSALLTGLFAMMQFVDINFAWKLREILSAIQKEPEALASTVRARERPVGLSLTPIIYSYHLAAAYITANLLYRKGLMPSRRLYHILVGAFMLMAAANGTRSLLIGIMAHEVLRHAGTFRLRSLLSIAVLVAVAIFGLDFLASIGSRVATITDPSAVGRWTLYEYGLQLARDNPFGYGWDFNPGDYAWLYWEQLSDMARAEAAFRLDIHNAFLNFVLIYGLYGVLIVALAALLNPALFLATSYFAFAYLLHSFFHNDGIFLGDDYFWFAYAIFIFIRDAEKAQTAPQPSAYTVPRRYGMALPPPSFTRPYGPR